MKNLFFIIAIVLCFGLSNSVDAQLTNVYVTGPECCPDLGTMEGTRADGGYTNYTYSGQTNGGGGPSFYNIPWYNSNFSIPCQSTLVVETITVQVVINGHEKLLKCLGAETKIIGYGMPLVFDIALDSYVSEIKAPGPPPPDQ